MEVRLIHSGSQTLKGIQEGRALYIPKLYVLEQNPLARERILDASHGIVKDALPLRRPAVARSGNRGVSEAGPVTCSPPPHSLSGFLPPLHHRRI